MTKESSEKPLLTPREGLVNTAQRRALEQGTPKPQVTGIDGF